AQDSGLDIGQLQVLGQGVRAFHQGFFPARRRAVSRLHFSPEFSSLRDRVAMRVASPGFLAALIVAAWAGFVAAAFFGLAVLPRWSLQQQVSAQEVALVSEAWWRSRRPDVAVPSLVWLAGP